MTKKIFAMFLAVLMVVSMLPTSVFAAGCPGKGNHTALNCNNTVLGVTEPTCKVPGFTAYKCNDCGEEFHDNVTPATGAHNYVDAPDKAPTCEEEGKQGRKVCSGCGDEIAATTIPSLSNGKYNCKWEIQNPEIDCLTGGEQVWKCATCGAEKIVKIDKKAAHTWGEFQLVTEATKDVPGKAVRTCACGAKDEVVVYYAHDCAKYLIAVEGYAKTCTTDGLAPHTECRICGTKYNAAGTAKLKNNEIAALTLKAGHTFAKTPTCADTLLQCTVATCGQWVNPGVEHDIDWVVKESEKAKGAEYVAPSCLKPGHIYDVCANCNKRDLKTLQPLGHKPVEVKANATCSTFAYTYTYCTRANCDSPVVSTADYAATLADERYDLTVHKFTFNEVAPVVGAGYYMALNHMTVGTVLYFNGQANGDYLTTSNDASQAVEVKVEKVHLLDTKGELLLYFYNEENVKTYIEIYEKDDGKVKVRLTTDKPENVYTWNSEKKVLTTKIGSKDYFLNCYTNNQGVAYETIGASELKYAPDTESAANTTFRASLVSVDSVAVPHVITFTLNKTAGFNSTAHPAWNSVVVTPATCTADGVKMVNCVFCGSTHQETIPASHSWVNATDNQVPGTTEKASQTVGCVDGWQWMICSVSGCGATKKVTSTGSGHVYGDVVEFVPNHTATNGYDTKTCKYCNDQVKLTYRVWEFIGVQFENLAAAQKAHGASNLTNGKVLSTGNCTTTGLTRYTCAGCNKDVLVKTEGQHLAPNAIDGVPVHQDPTCTDKGWDLTYKCQREGCGAIVGAAALGQKNEIPALGHDFKVAKDHKCAGCDNPNYGATHSTCTRCTETVACYELLKQVVVSTEGKGKDLCEKSIMEYYWCEKCQDEHIRSFVKAMGHEFETVTNDKGEIVYTKAPTCTTPGEYTVKCAVCGKEEPRVAAPIAHVNAAGEKFFEKCTDTVADRHCVKCCQCTTKGAAHNCTADQDKNTAGVQTCPCVIPADHQYNSVKMPSTCSMPPYLAMSCPDCGHRTNKVMTEVDGEAVIFDGHKPAAIDMIPEVGEDGKLTGNMVAVKYPGFVYVENFEYTYYVVENDEWVKKVDVYTAKFIERKAASYTEEGYDHFFCQICKTEEKNVKAKLSGLGFEFSVENALGGNEFTYGSLIEVVVSVNGNNAAVHGFNFNVSVANAVAGAKFVGYEKLNEDFNLVVLKPENTGSKATISGFAANDASGKQQNITINGKTELVKLYFRLADKAFVDASSLTAKFEPVPNQPAVTVLKDGNSVDVSANTNILNKDFATRGFLNFNNDTAANTKDLQMAMSMITLEHVDGKTYDVTVDVNKDGVVDLQDLSIAYNYVVGNYDLVDLLVMGISAEEILLLDLNEKVLCNNPNCQYELDADWNRCPICGNYQ